MDLLHPNEFFMKLGESWQKFNGSSESRKALLDPWIHCSCDEKCGE